MKLSCLKSRTTYSESESITKGQGLPTRAYPWAVCMKIEDQYEHQTQPWIWVHKWTHHPREGILPNQSTNYLESILWNKSIACTEEESLYWKFFWWNFSAFGMLEKMEKIWEQLWSTTVRSHTRCHVVLGIDYKHPRNQLIQGLWASSGREINKKKKREV